MTSEQAQEVADALRNTKAEQCKMELQKVLDKYNCQIHAYPIIVDGRIVIQTEIVAVI